MKALLLRTDLLSLPDPLVADPLDAQRGGARSVQGHRSLHAEPGNTMQIQHFPTFKLSWQSPIKVVPEYSGPRAGPGCHAHVGKGGEASHQVREVEHHLQYSAIIQYSIVQEEVEHYRGYSVPHPHSAGVPVRAHL